MKRVLLCRASDKYAYILRSDCPGDCRARLSINNIFQSDARCSAMVTRSRIAPSSMTSIPPESSMS